MSQTHDQQRFTISEVAADWHEPMVPQRITAALFVLLTYFIIAQKVVNYVSVIP